MSSAKHFKVGDKIKTSQYPWAHDQFEIEAIQEIKPNRFLFCVNLRTGKYVNLVEPFCDYLISGNKFTKLTNLQIIKLTKLGNKQALKEYIRRFKSMPKFIKNGR